MEKQNTDSEDWQKGHRSRERQGGRTNQDFRMIVKVQGKTLNGEEKKCRTHLKQCRGLGIWVRQILAVFTGCLHSPLDGIQWLSFWFNQSFNASLIEKDEQAPIAARHALPAPVSFVVLGLFWLWVQTGVVFFIKAC